MIQILFLAFSVASAQNISKLSQLINTPGLSFKEDGSVVTDWSKKGPTLSYPIETNYKKSNSDYVKIKVEKNGDKSIVIASSDGNPSGGISDYLFAVDRRGIGLTSVTRCSTKIKRCNYVSRDLCADLYKSTKTKNAVELTNLANTCQKLSEPDFYFRQLGADDVNEYLQTQTLINSLPVEQNRTSILDWFSSAKPKSASVTKSDGLSQKDIWVDHAEVPGRFFEIAELCKQILPTANQDYIKSKIENPGVN